MPRSMTERGKFLIALGSWMLAATIAHAQLSNGNFETGTLPPWTGTGTATVNGTFAAQAPAEGSFQAVISTPQGGTVTQSALETFLGLSSNALNSVRGSGLSSSGGSAIKQTFTVQAGQAIAFSWDFLPNGSFVDENDSAFFTLHLSGSSSSSVTVLSSVVASGGSPTGYRRFGTAQLPAGSYLLGFSAFDAIGNGGNDHRPDLLIDNVQVFSCTPPPSGMIAWWPGDGNARDIVGIHNGTEHGNAASGPGKVGGGFTFDGNGDWVDVGDVDLPVTFTIDAWINPTSLATGPMVIIKDDGSNRSYFLQIFSAGDLRGAVFNSTGTSTEYISTTDPVTTGSWQHIAMTYDGNAAAGAKIKFYYNGAAIAANPASATQDDGGTPKDTAVSALIGIFNAAGNAFAGGIDELELFNRVLSQSEIQAIYAADVAGKCKPIVYVSNFGNNTIEQFDANGGPSLFTGTNVSTPQGIAFDGGGNLYLANRDIHAIEKFDSNGTGTLFADSTDGLGRPTGLAFDRAGNLYVTDLDFNKIWKFDPAGVVSTFADTGLDQSYALAFDGAGNLYASNFNNSTIEKFDSAGNPTLFSTLTTGDTPLGIAFDPAGNLFAAAYGHHIIYKIDSNGVATTFADSSDGVDFPFGLAFDRFGSLYVVNQSNKILKFDTATGDHFQFAGPSGLSSPAFIAIQPPALPTPAPTPVNRRFVNISSRVSVGTGDNVAIAGFIPKSGEPTAAALHTNAVFAHPKTVLIRGLGPSLNVLGTPVPGRLANPVLELRDGNHNLITSNDNWRSTQETQIQATGLAPTDNNEAAILITLEADAGYTAILSGAGNTSGIGLVEVYDLDPLSETHLANISTRGQVLTGDDRLIGGVIIRGGDSRQVLVRALGPSLTGVSGVLQDPQLDIRDAQGTSIVTDDDWADSQGAAIIATGLQPTDPKESAILFNDVDASHTLNPGNYTAIMSGVSGGIGIGLFEAYRLGPP